MTFRAIVFDWDGTLVDTAEATFLCYRRTLAEYGIDFDRDAFARMYAPSGADMVRSRHTASGRAGARLPRARRPLCPRYVRR